MSSSPTSPRPRLDPRKLELLIGSIRDYAIFMLDAQGLIASWNLGARTITGYEPEEIIGRPLETFYTPEDRAAGLPQALLARARAEGRAENQGWRVCQDGSRFFADVVITALRDERGELVGYAKVTRDLTEKRRLDASRFESEQRFRLLVDSVQDYAIFMLHPDGRVATWNAGAARIKGYRADEIIGTHFSVFYPPETRLSGLPALELERAVRDGRFEEENWRMRKDGTRFWASVVLTPMRNLQNEHVGFVKVTRDLTERKRAEEERLRLARATESIRLRDEFLSIASHELRTPLMALQLQIESLQRLVDPDPAKLATKLERADKSVRRMAELVETLLDVTRIASGHLTLRPRETDLAEVVSEVVDRMQETAMRASSKLACQVETGIIGSWDALRMEQAVTNLVSNALEYAAGSDVEVSLRRDGGRATLRVTDGGPGIDPARIGGIFERFERAADPRHHGGLGLGLYVTREIVAAHGGTVRAANRDGGGAVFEVDLPERGLGRP